MRLTFLLLLSTLSTVSAYSQKQIVVAKDGSGDFRIIQEAINSIRAYSPEAVTVLIKNGIYKEKVVVPSWVTGVTLIGESRDNTIITNDDFSGKFIAKGTDTLINKTKFSTFNSYTLWVQGNDITIQNLTIRNTAGRVGQAVALHVDGDRFVLKDCNVLGNQDTLLTANDSSRQYYTNCFIEGTTDFIFGPATALFQRCTIKSLSNSYITAASTTKGKKYGYVFLDCKLIANDEAQKVFLGRPWRAYAQTVFINCEMGKHIRPEGWDNWRNPENEKTAFYAEYKSYGEGASISTRVKWSHQLSVKEAKKYTPQKILAGHDNWRPI